MRLKTIRTIAVSSLLTANLILQPIINSMSVYAEGITIVENNSSIEDGTYKIFLNNSNFALDVYGGYDANGTNIQLWTSTDIIDQEIKIDSNDDYSKLWFSLSEDKLLDVNRQSAYPAENDNITMYENTDPDSQEWIFSKLSNGSYAIRLKNYPEYAIRVEEPDDGNLSNGLNIYLDYFDETNPYFQWTFDKYTSDEETTDKSDAYVYGTVNYLNIRNSNSNSSPIIGKAKEGSKVTIIGETNLEWIKVAAKDSITNTYIEGYCYSEYLTDKEPEASYEESSYEESSITTSATASSGAYIGWLQTSSGWGSTKLTNRTMSEVGCAVTSAAMLIVHSGLRNDSSFNPGTLCTYLNSNGGFVNNNIYWEKISGLIPEFQFKGSVSLSGNQADKLAAIKNYYEQGYYIIVSVKNGGHFVAVQNVTDSNVTIMDPSQSYTDLFSNYNTSQINSIRLFSAPISSYDR